jgi:DNA modification methylase
MSAHRSKQRRSLAHTGGPVELWGQDPAETSALAYALDVRPDEATRDHVHGFHSYPGRMHPLTARRLIERLSKPRARVLDPFCGSGTTLVEACLLGRHAVGIDANPLAIELAWLKTGGITKEETKALLARALEVKALADNRRLRRAGATRRYGAEDVALFDPHVLLELDGLRSGISALENGAPRRALFLVLSAILVKVSRRPGDTGKGALPRRLAAGFTSALFFDKTRELAQRLEEFRRLLPKIPSTRSALAGDARALPRELASSVDLVLTSPPYPGNYDYLAHHALRLRWLGLDADTFARTELGARRHLAPLREPAAVARWSSELSQVLSAMSGALAKDGKIVLVLADSVIQRTAIYADQQLRRLAPAAGLEVTAIGSQRRPHFHGETSGAFDRAPRREHVIILRRRS